VSTTETSPAKLTYIVGRLEKVIRTEIDRRLRPLGISRAQYTALSILSRRPGLSNAQLARRTYLTPQAMLEVTTTLERAGFIERSLVDGNRKVLANRLTPSGAEILTMCDEVADTLESEMLARLPASRRNALRTGLLECVRALHAGFYGSTDDEPELSRVLSDLE
jgi:DNA-binding MarR family transcriptional regulator